jgi:glycosyltransferase involved in cell wall biosynthesis
VRSKGPTELILALRQFLDLQKGFQIRLDMIGNLGFSDQNLVAETKNEMHKLLLKHGTSISIEIHWNAPEKLKHEILADSDIFVLPTYHEGFCVPIVEALASGCRIISYENSNVPAVSGGFATLVRTGDIQGIATSLSQMAFEITSDAWRNPDNGGYVQYMRETQEYVSTFSVWRTKKRFINFITSMMNERKKGNVERGS